MIQAEVCSIKELKQTDSKREGDFHLFTIQESRYIKNKTLTGTGNQWKIALLLQGVLKCTKAAHSCVTTPLHIHVCCSILESYVDRPAYHSVSTNHRKDFHALYELWAF